MLNLTRYSILLFCLVATSFVYGQPPVPTVAIAGCSATINVTGGAPPYVYLWSPSGATTSAISGLAPGTYSVTVSGTGCGCELVVNGGFESGNTGFTSGYPCCAGGTGNYNINTTGGHTGANSMSFNGGGSFMVWSQTVNVLPNTNYCLSGWGYGSAKSPVPNFDFRINGTSQGPSINPYGVWGQFTATWNSGASTTANIVIQDITGSSGGNNGQIDDISLMGPCDTTITFTIVAPPITVSNDTTICPGNLVNLTAGGGTAYQWSTNESTASISVAPTTTTQYSVGVTAGGCIVKDSVMVTVSPLPTPAFTAPNSCLNTITNFTDQSTGGTQWLWNFGEPSSGANNTATVQSPNHTFSSAGNYTISLTVTNPFGCSDSISNIVTINPLPAPTFSATTVCTGGTTSFTDLSTVVSGTITTWNWNFGDAASGPNNISGLQNPTHVFSDSGTYNVLLTVISASGCQSSTTLPVTVSPVPTASFTATNICQNVSSTLTDASMGAQQWAWILGDGTSSAQQNPSHTYSTYGNFNVILTVTSSGGCSNTYTNTITVYPSPIPNFTSDSVCITNQTSFNNTSTIPSGSIAGWLWDFGDGNSSIIQNPTNVYPSAGTFTATLTATSNNNCITFISAPVTVHPKPAADFSSSPTPTGNLSDPISFTDLSSSDVVGWFWNFGDGITQNPNVPNPLHLYADTGTYSVTLITISDFGCMDTVMYPVHIVDFAFYAPSAFTPNGDGLNDLFSGYGIGITKYAMQIFDRWGNVVFTTTDLTTKWDGTVRNNIQQQVPEDVYVWQVKLTDLFSKVHHYTGNVTVIR